MVGGGSEGLVLDKCSLCANSYIFRVGGEREGDRREVVEGGMEVEREGGR